MYQLNTKGVSLTASHIKSVKDNSDSSIRRIFIEFKNGETLFIVRGQGTYGSENGLFEIKPSCPEVLRSYDASYDYNDAGAEGHLSVEDLNYYIEKIGSMPKNGGGKCIKT